MKLLSVLILFLGLQLGAQAQSKDFLLLKRGSNQKTQIRFYAGEDLTYQSRKFGYFITDQIVRIDKDYIYLTENILAPADIEAIDIRNKDPRNRTLRNLNALFLGAGAILLAVELVNSGGISEGVGITSGILVGTGLAMIPLRYKIFKNEGKNRIQLVIMTFE
jgi:hypothetical protein